MKACDQPECMPHVKAWAFVHPPTAFIFSANRSCTTPLRTNNGTERSTSLPKDAMNVEYARTTYRHQVLYCRSNSQTDSSLTLEPPLDVPPWTAALTATCEQHRSSLRPACRHHKIDENGTVKRPTTLLGPFPRSSSVPPCYVGQPPYWRRLNC